MRPRVLVLAATAESADPRARRQIDAAEAAGIDVAFVGLPTRPQAIGTGARASALRESHRPLLRELRGLTRLLRVTTTTARLVMRAARRPRPSIVHANDLDTLLAAYVVSRWRRARLVYDAHELYTGFDADPPRIWLRAITRIEGWLARAADAVITVSPEIAEELGRRYRLTRRPVVVLNCPALEPSEPAAHRGPIRIVYQAAVGPGRDLDELARAAALAGVEVSARVLGASSFPPGIHRLEPVGPDALVRALLPFDVGLVIDQASTDNTRFALPNKLFEYLMAGLAVVVPDAPAMAALVERDGVGRTYAPGGLSAVLSELARDRLQVEALRVRARRAAVERYNAASQRPLLYQAWGL